MKKSKLRNIIRESIKELIIEQRSLENKKCVNDDGEPTICSGFKKACQKITSQTFGGSGYFWTCCENSNGIYTPGSIWDTDSFCNQYITYGYTHFGLTPYGVVGKRPPVVSWPGCCNLYSESPTQTPGFPHPSI